VAAATSPEPKRRCPSQHKCYLCKGLLSREAKRTHSVWDIGGCNNSCAVCFSSIAQHTMLKVQVSYNQVDISGLVCCQLVGCNSDVLLFKYWRAALPSSAIQLACWASTASGASSGSKVQCCTNPESLSVGL
jgi:hypothetical protein